MPSSSHMYNNPDFIREIAAIEVKKYINQMFNLKTPICQTPCISSQQEEIVIQGSRGKIKVDLGTNKESNMPVATIEHQMPSTMQEPDLRKENEYLKERIKQGEQALEIANQTIRELSSRYEYECYRGGAENKPASKQPDKLSALDEIIKSLEEAIRIAQDEREKATSYIELRSVNKTIFNIRAELKKLYKKKKKTRPDVTIGATMDQALQGLREGFNSNISAKRIVLYAITGTIIIEILKTLAQ